MNDHNQISPLTVRHRIGYALGDFGGCMTFGLMAAFTTRYYINVAMIDTAVIAAMTLIWKLFDALANPFVGVMLDKSFAASGGKRDKFRPWLLRMAPMLSVCAILVFTAPGWVDGMARLVVAFSTYLLYEAVYAIHVIAFAGLISGMAVTDDERSQLSSARGIGGTLGGILPQVLFPRIIEAFEGNPQLGYGMGVTVCAAIGLVLCLCCYAMTEERNPASRTVNAAPIRVTDIVTVLTKNRAVLALCLHGMLQGVLMAVSGSLGTYMYADVLGRLSLMSTAAILGLPVTILFMSCAPKFIRKFGSDRVLRTSLLLGAGLYVGLFALHALTTVNIWVHIAWNAIASGMANLSNMMQWGMLGESIEYNEYLTGKRTEGSINGTFNMLRRAGQGLGAATGVALLGLIGYNAEASVQTAFTIFGIKALCLLFPAACALGSWLVFRFIWNITPELRQQIAAAADRCGQERERLTFPRENRIIKPSFSEVVPMSNIYTSAEQLIGHTPMLRLLRLEAAHNLNCRLLVKLESANPGGSAKDRVARAMLDDAEDRGLIGPGATIIEPTSGNTGIGLAAVCAQRGYRCIIVMPDTMSAERQKLMTAYGAQLVLTPGAQGMLGSIARANELAAAIPGSFIPDQFSNPANAAAHYRTTGPEIWTDTDGEVDMFIAGVGTGGTITGVGKYLKERRDVQIIAVEPKSSPLLSGGKAGPHGLQGIGANFVPDVLDTAIYDEILPVTEEAAYAAARELGRTEGILCGISSGAALHAALEIAARPENTGKTIVALLPDTGERYLSTALFA